MLYATPLQSPPCPSRTIVVFSGGLDSTTLLYHQRAAGDDVRALSADYGQRHGGRPNSPRRGRSLAATLGVEHRVLDLRGLADFLRGEQPDRRRASRCPRGPYTPGDDGPHGRAEPQHGAAVGGTGLGVGGRGGRRGVRGARRRVHALPRLPAPRSPTAMHAAAQVCDARPLASPRPVRGVVVRPTSCGGRSTLGVPLGGDVELLRGGGDALRMLRHLPRPPRGAFAEAGVADPTGVSAADRGERRG